MKFALLGAATLALAGSLAVAHPPAPTKVAANDPPAEVIALGPGSTCPNGLVLKGTPSGGSYHPTMTWSCVPNSGNGATKPVTGTGSHGINPSGSIHSITVQNTPTPAKKCKDHTANALIASFGKC